LAAAMPTTISIPLRVAPLKKTIAISLREQTSYKRRSTKL
jgi:hypothetical protein